MDAQLIARITRVSRRRHSRKTKAGTILRGPYWYGWYQEDGKSISVYIGRELPKELKRLITKRYKKPGYRNYTWPRPRA